MAWSRCRRSPVFAASPVSRDTDVEFWHRGVPRKRFRAFVVHSDGGNLRRLRTVRAPDQQQQGTIRLKKSHVFSRNVHHRPHCTRSQHGRGHPLNPCVGRGVGSQGLGRPTWYWQLRPSSEPTFEPRRQNINKSPGHFLRDKRKLSPECEPRVHTLATTITWSVHDADIVWKVPVIGWH